MIARCRGCASAARWTGLSLAAARAARLATALTPIRGSPPHPHLTDNGCNNDTNGFPVVIGYAHR